MEQGMFKQGSSFLLESWQEEDKKQGRPDYSIKQFSIYTTPPYIFLIAERYV